MAKEKQIVDDLQQTKSNIEDLKLQADRSEREGDYGVVAEIRYGKLQDEELKMSELKNKLAKFKSENSLIRERLLMMILLKLYQNGLVSQLQK